MSETKKQCGKKSLPEKVESQRELVTKAIVNAMQREGLSWVKEWDTRILAPRNPTHGTFYSGGNRLGLMGVAAVRGYADPRWCTFKQAQEAGYKLKRGAKAAVVERWKQYTYQVGDDVDGLDTDGIKTVSYIKCVGYWNVFNFAEMEGPKPFALDDGWDNSCGEIEYADALIASSRCPVIESAQICAYFSPAKDEIHLPLRGTFKMADSFLRTLAHEMCHSTGMPLGRGMDAFFGTEEYAFEELIAEIGSAFVCADGGFGVGSYGVDHMENHAAYLKSWLCKLDDDVNYVYRAATQAQKAADYITSRVKKSAGNDGKVA